MFVSDSNYFFDLPLADERFQIMDQNMPRGEISIYSASYTTGQSQVP